MSESDHSNSASPNWSPSLQTHERSLDDFLRSSQHLVEETLALFAEKNKSYAKDENIFDNFQDVARMTGQPPRVVLGIYLYKHLRAIFKYIDDGYESEPIKGRIQDAINYLFVLWSMVQCEQSSQQDTSPVNRSTPWRV